MACWEHVEAGAVVKHSKVWRKCGRKACQKHGKDDKHGKHKTFRWV